jgi:hypothetical protein
MYFGATTAAVRRAIYLIGLPPQTHRISIRDY